MLFTKHDPPNSPTCMVYYKPSLYSTYFFLGGKFLASNIHMFSWVSSLLMNIF